MADLDQAIHGGLGGVAECPESHHFSKTAYGSMSLNNKHPVNNEGQGSNNGSGNRAEDKSKDKGLGSPSATYKRSDQVKDRKTDRQDNPNLKPELNHGFRTLPDQICQHSQIQKQTTPYSNRY